MQQIVYPSSLLTKQEAALYNKNGFLLKRDLFSEAEKSQLIKCANEIQSWPETAGKWLQYFDYADQKRILARTENFLPYIGESFYGLRDKILQASAELLNEPCKVYKDKLIFKFAGSYGFNAHQDGAGYMGFEFRPHIVVMISVDKADRSNGCLQVIRGFPWNDCGEYDAEIDEKLLAKWEKEKSWEFVETEPGDVFFFGMHVPHRSDANTDSTKTRRVFYLTINRSSEGECREKYFKVKRSADPPEVERRRF